MNFRQLMLVALLVLGVCGLLWQNAMAATRLGLHVTQEELNIWKQRAVSGPYKTTGDVSPNSPGDWNRIAANASSLDQTQLPTSGTVPLAQDALINPSLGLLPSPEMFVMRDSTPSYSKMWI